MRIYLLRTALLLNVVLATLNLSAQTFSNANGITIVNGTAPSSANPFPSTMNVSGLSGTITKVTITLIGLTTFSPDHVDMLLIGPEGQTLVFWSDAGGTAAISNQTITIDDVGATQLPDATQIFSGTFRPANYDAIAEATEDVFPSPAPIGPYNNALPSGTSTLAIFNGTNPNGAWKLYIVEDAGDAANGSIAGWSLTFNTTGTPPASPFVTINQAESQSDPANAGVAFYVRYTAVFSQAVTGFISSDILLSGTAGATQVIVGEIAPNNGTTFEVAVLGMTTDGTVIATIPAGVVTGSNGIVNSASTSVDNTITYNLTCVPTCPDNILTTATSPSGTNVNYDITPFGDCRSMLSLPGSGTSFPIGTTTVNVYTNTNTENMYVLTGSGLYKFNPGNQAATQVGPIPITGLPTGYGISSIDFSPTGQLYGLGKYACNENSLPTCARVFAIDKVTGAATQIGTQDFTLIGGGHELEFDPVTNTIHIIGSTYQEHHVVDITTGYNVWTSFKQDPPFMKGVAFSNNFPGATYTTLYAVGTDGNLHTIGGMHGDPAPSMTAITLVGDLNPDPNAPFVGVSTDRTGFDISQRGNAYMISDNNFSSINLHTGEASLLGIFSFAGFTDFSIEPETLPSPVCSFTVTVTPLPVTVTINKSSNQPDPAINIPVRFTVEFSEEVTGFDASDISFAGSTVPGALTATITGTGPTYTVIVTGMTGAGDVVASIPAGAATSADGVTSLASTSTDNVIQLLVFQNDFVITKNAASPYVAAGGVITYIVNVQRLLVLGTNPPYQGVEVTDLLPAGTTFIGFEPLQVNTAIPVIILPPINTNGTVRLVFPSLFPTQNFSFLLRVRVGAEMTGTVSNTATVNGPLGDVNPANNSATAIVQILEPPTITCPENIIINADPGKCDAGVSFTGENEIVVTGSAYTASYTVFYEGGGRSGSGIPGTLLLPIGVNTINITAANDAGSSSCSFTVTVVDNQPPVINCPSNIIANAQAGQCSADVSITISGSDNCLSDRGLTVASAVLNTFIQYPGISSFSASQIRNFSVGTTTVNVLATDASGNTATCSFNVTVLDIEKPVITSNPSDVTVECTSQIPAVNIASVTATDNCGTPTITHVDDVISNRTCANKYTVTRTYRATDGSGNTATVTQLITIDDKTPPTLTGLTPSKRILAPPNHKMVDITLAYTINDNCASSPNVTISITSNEPENGTGDGDTDTDWEIIDNRHIRLRAERSAQGTGRTYTITVTVSDGCNSPVSATTEVMVVHNITAPHSGNSFKVGSTVAFTGEFWDVPTNKHTAKWLIDGSTTAKAIVTEPIGNKNGKVTGSYKFTTPGVYKLQMNVTDQNGVTTFANTNGDVDAIIVIYDPNGGHTYGGGYFNSPAGALVANSSSTGKASYGFAMNYFKNSTNPKGETQFEFKVGEFEFNALNFDYLVISNSMAQFKGTGKIIGGQSGIGFTMTVTDGQLDGSGIDKIRMKIYNKNNGKIIYDNQPGASDAALPVQAVGSNSIVVISGNNNSNLTRSNTASKNTEMEAPTKPPNGLDIIAYPNPTTNNFSITVQAEAKEKITMQVVDMYGRVIETRNVSANSIVRFGDRYKPGTYFVRIIQGKEHKELKLVKLSD